MFLRENCDFLASNMANSSPKRYQRDIKRTATVSSSELVSLTDDDAGLSVSVAPDAGAEIASLRKRSGGEWVELLDRAEDFTPCDRWRGRAPWLWPAVGRSYLLTKLERAANGGPPPSDFEWELGGNTYPMPIHGFAMNRAWKLTGVHTDDSGALAECSLTDDPATRRLYPFGFSNIVSTAICDGVMTSSFRVEAARGNSSPMPFCIGNHITLRTPVRQGGTLGEVHVFAPVRRVYSVTELGLVGAAGEISFREGVSLADPRLHNLIVGHFPPEQANVRIVDSCGWEIDVGHREVAADRTKAPPDAFFFVFYASAEDQFFCPEPWLGLPNALNSGRGLVRLPAGESFEWQMSVRVVAPTA